MKLRYTSLQVDVGAGEEQYPDLPTDLGGMPVVVASLHSQVPGIAVGIREEQPDARITYVMTDGAALPLAFSDLVVQLRDLGLVDATITAGHAFGGDLEAVTVPSALALARHAQGADVTIVAMGPGVVGTGTRLGTTAIEVASIVDVVGKLGGRAILCLRVGERDGRARHRGVSHHTLTALGLLHGPALVAHTVDGHEDALDRGAAGPAVATVSVPSTDVAGRFATLGLRVTTMGRGPDEEPAFFAATAAAGRVAGALLRSGP